MKNKILTFEFKGSNDVAIGYDEGSILIKLGREEPAMSMDSSGKIIWAKHCEVQQANLKAIGKILFNFTRFLKSM